jgi:hypothetical protein
MFRDFHQVEQVLEAGVSSQSVVEIVPANFPNRGHFDVAFFQPIYPPHLDTRRLPDADTGGDFAALDQGSQFFGEQHKVSSSISRIEAG